MRWVLLALLLVAIAISARADGVRGIGNQGINGMGVDGIFNPGSTVMPPPPTGCNGVIDLTTSCVVPALGGL